jgi:hypothetical protein
MTENLFTHEGITYRKVSRKANVGEKVVLSNPAYTYEECSDIEVGNVYEVTGICEKLIEVRGSSFRMYHREYAVLEPVEQPKESLTQSDDLFVTEADVRNNPRQVIDLIVNLAGRLTKLESKVDRLASANEQAITTVARNVETWAQDMEGLRKKLDEVNERTQPYQQAHELFVKIAGGLNERKLTAEERREL